MIKKICYILGLCAAFFAAGCSESLEDTYDEFVEGGMIRYVGKCADVAVNPGWERLQVIWKNNIDSGIDSVKITWQGEGGPLHTRLIDRTNAGADENLMDTTYLENLGDTLYTVRVSNLDSEGSESLVDIFYARPYTLNHEDLRSFTRGISMFSQMGGGHLAVTLDQYNENIDSMVLCYYGTDGKEYTWDMKKHMTDSLEAEDDWGIPVELGRDYMHLLPEEEGVQIDFNRDIVVKRTGRLMGCIDPITFADEKLNMEERLWSTEFVQLMTGRYGEDWQNEIATLETLEIDYDMLSMQDLLYLPALKKVVLGKNRYMATSFAKNPNFMSTTDEYVGLMTLAFLYETQPGFTVERYNNHYFFAEGGLSGTPYLDLYKRAGKIDENFEFQERASTNLDSKPQYVKIDTTGWEVTCSDTTHNGYKTNGAGWLLWDTKRVTMDYWGYPSDPEEVYFEPSQTMGAAIITVTFDMKEQHMVAGFKVAQPERNQQGDTDYLLSSLMIEFSNNGGDWVKATYTDGSATIGNSPDEETFIQVPTELQKPYRYIRISMSNLPVSSVSGYGLYNLRLSEFIPLSSLAIQ